MLLPLKISHIIFSKIFKRKGLSKALNKDSDKPFNYIMLNLLNLCDNR